MGDKEPLNEFEKLVQQLSVQRIDYEMKETHRIKDRAYHMLGLSLIVISSIIALTSIALNQEKQFPDFNIAILIIGFFIFIPALALCYYVMTAKANVRILDPEDFYKIYKDKNIEDTKGVLRVTMFDMIKKMNDRNERFALLLRIVYVLFPIGTVAMFIAILSILIV